MASRALLDTPNDAEFDKVFQRTLAPPGESPPESEQLEGPEESPTNAPNAPSSQMDPLPQPLPLPLLIVPLVDGEVALAPPVVAPVVLATLDPLEALDIQAVQVTELAPVLEVPPELEEAAEEPDEPEEPVPVAPTLNRPEARAEKAPVPSEQIDIREMSASRSRAQVLDHIEVLAAKQTKVKIEMNPLDLGPMTVQVSQEGKEIKTHVVVENPALRYALDRAQANLTVALSEAGMNLSQFSMENGNPQERPEDFAFASFPRAVHESKSTYQSTSGGLELWA